MLPQSVDGLVVANEWLDDMPCHVVEVDPDGVSRVVHVDPATGEESLGSASTGASVPPSLAAWLERWWPLAGREPGARAEVGTSRDAPGPTWSARVGSGLAVAVDYGHTARADRPAAGSLRSYRGGREVEVVPDGSCDVTAHVAVDAVAGAVGGRVLRQRDVLDRLGLDPRRPSPGRAGTDPAGYLRDLAASTAAADLRAVGGLGDFYWVLSAAGGVTVALDV